MIYPTRRKGPHQTSMSLTSLGSWIVHCSFSQANLHSICPKLVSIFQVYAERLDDEKLPELPEEPSWKIFAVKWIDGPCIWLIFMFFVGKYTRYLADYG